MVLLCLAFTLSGAAGLIYESIWSRYLGLFVGHSSYAQIIVLTIFLGGMSAGALAVGHRSERVAHPLLAYAAVEFATGLIGLVFHTVYVTVTTAAYDTLFPALAGTSWLTVTKWILASALILPQSVLLGTTFPLMSAGLLRRAPGRPGHRLALLYFANSFGAACGVLIAGFVLIAAVGLPGTILTAAVLNIVVAALTYLIARTKPPAPAEPDAPTEGAAAGTYPPPDRNKTRPLWPILSIVSFGTAVASFGYEIGWIRMLSLVLGGATHSFELMLSAFILGLALGALWARRTDRLRDPLLALGSVQWIMGCAALATLPIYVSSFGWVGTLLQVFAKTDAGYLGFNVARYGLCLVIMVPATFCAGITLPLITRTLLVGGHGERAIGWIYGVNTFGSIVGVIVAGLVVLPWLGLKTLLLLAAGLDMSLGALVLFARAAPHRRPAVALVTAGMLAAVALIGRGIQFDTLLLTSGVYRTGDVPTRETREVLFYHDGRTATVAALRDRRTGHVYLSTNGKPDASLDPQWFTTGSPVTRAPLRGDGVTQALLALVTLAHAPDARRGAVIGYGSGMSSHLLLGSSAMAELVTIEIEPSMVEAARIFYPVNRRVFDDPRSITVIDDARSHFAADARRYDLILSEPSNPWVSGVASLFTEEFYAQIARTLAPRGVFGQWLHLYELNDDLALSVLTALHRQFTSYALFLLNSSDLLILASTQPTLPAPDWHVLAQPLLAADLARFTPFAPDALDSLRLVGRDALAPLLDRWVLVNSDFFPQLDLGAEEARYEQQYAGGLHALAVDRFPVTLLFSTADRAPAVDRTLTIADHPTILARAVSAALRTGSDGALPILNPDDPRYQYWRWQTLIAADRPPSDWRPWLAGTLDVERVLHAGSRGIVDERFYGQVHTYLEHHPPPVEACDTLTFVEALGRADFATAMPAGDRLVTAAQSGRLWISADLVRDGVVLAKLQMGDRTGARQQFAALAGKVQRAANDLRSRLLRAYVDTAVEIPIRARVGPGMIWQCRPQSGSTAAEPGGNNAR